MQKLSKVNTEGIEIKNLIYAVIVGIAVFGIFYALFMVGNDVLYNSDDGLLEELDDSAQQDMDGVFLDRWNANKGGNDEKMFGITGIFIGAVIIICIGIYALESRRKPQQ